MILPILLMLVGGIVQYGIIFATKHSLIEVGRDLGRWAATQTYDPCSSAASEADPQPVTRADLLAQESRLMGYTAGEWDASNFVPYPDNDPLPDPDPDLTQAIEVVWSYEGTSPCPPLNSTHVAWVTIRLSHRAPVVLPGFPYLPGLGDCDAEGCFFVVRTTTQFRMEPVAAP